MTRIDAATAARLSNVGNDRSESAPSGTTRVRDDRQASRPSHAVGRHLAPRSAGAQLAEAGSEGERALETQLRQTGVGGWARELRFDAARQWRFDFAWPEEQLAVEVEGATWAAGRHSRGSGFEADCVKYAEAVIRGWAVIRVTTDMVDDGRAISLIGRALWAISQRRNGR